MNWVPISDDSTNPATPVVGQFTLENSAGAAVNADSLPTVDIRPSDVGSADAATNLGAVVSNISTGVYHVSVVVADIIANDAITTGPWWPVVTAVIGGITKKIPLSPFDLRPYVSFSAVVTDAGNTATAFMITGNATGYAPVFDSDDGPVFGLLLFVTGALAGQLAEIDSWDGTTDIITLKRALTAIPTGGDLFRLINV